jgi:hypothetical protein
MHCGKRKNNQVVEAVRNPKDQGDQQIQLTQAEQGALAKFTGEISRSIKTPSLMDAISTNCEMPKKIIVRFDVSLWESTVSTDSRNFAFHCGTAAVEHARVRSPSASSKLAFRLKTIEF